jgi:hypothetical protein
MDRTRPWAKPALPLSEVTHLSISQQLAAIVDTVHGLVRLQLGQLVVGSMTKTHRNTVTRH